MVMFSNSGPVQETWEFEGAAQYLMCSLESVCVHVLYFSIGRTK